MIQCTYIRKDCIRDLDWTLVKLARFLFYVILYHIWLKQDILGQLIITWNWLEPKTKPTWQSYACPNPWYTWYKIWTNKMQVLFYGKKKDRITTYGIDSQRTNTLSVAVSGFSSICSSGLHRTFGVNWVILLTPKLR